MIDYFTIDGTPWPRRLWDVGSILALEELWEAAGWAAQRVLSPGACDWQRNELQSVIGPDVGLGERGLRKEITSLLKAPIQEPSPARRRLRELIEHARIGYIERWEAAVQRQPADRPRPERLARTVAAHLLDLGYDAAHLLNWAEQMRNKQATAMEVVEAAAELARAPRATYEVLVVLTATPQRELAESLPTWRSKGEVVAWLKQRGHDTAGLRVGGGFLYGVTARDPFGAAAEARQLLDRMIARSSFLRARRDGIKPAESIWVDGYGLAIAVAAPARGADIMALVHEKHLYRVEERQRIDDALELAAPVNRGAVAPAAAGAWAAIESLMLHPDDPHDESERSNKAVAADRFANIIACSWPRAELTALAHRHRPEQPDELFLKIEACGNNREKANLVAEAIRADQALDFTSSRAPHSDQAAARRMKQVLVNPGPELNNAAKTFRIGLRRLYRIRNIVLHGGATQSVALHATLRTAAPLVGAGLDRIAHASLTEGIDPLDLAARAELALSLVGGETGLTPVELLEKRSV
ncbi:integrase [Catellatospora methionotrophica]|uniref:integrase n=1 Tax=Catellatospora methionotrophica TaxID=121620 RepID=UPI0033F87EF8